MGETTEHVIIHVAGSPTLCVPKRAFADPQALAAFTRELRDRHETSRGA